MINLFAARLPLQNNPIGLFKKAAERMALANLAVSVMMIGLIVHARNLQMAEAARTGTIAWREFTRAAEFGLLITILAMPWLIVAAILLR